MAYGDVYGAVLEEDNNGNLYVGILFEGPSGDVSEERWPQSSPLKSMPTMWQSICRKHPIIDPPDHRYDEDYYGEQKDTYIQFEKPWPKKP